MIQLEIDQDLYISSCDRVENGLGNFKAQVFP